MRPELVQPANFKLTDVIYTSADGSFSIVKGEISEEYIDCFAMRWNGDFNNNDDKGFPLESGEATWFRLPVDIRSLLSTLIAHSNPMTL